MSVRHIATSYSGSVAAIGAFERVVIVSDLATGEVMTAADTVLEFGGERLAVDPAGRFFSAAAYTRKGVACYDATTGSLVWHQSRIKHVRQLAYSADGSRLYCSSGERPAEVLESSTGEIVARLSGVARVWESPWERLAVMDKHKPVLATPDGTRVASFERTTFALLDAAFSQDAFCTTESSGPVCCRDLHGNQRWAYTPPVGSHLLNLAFSADERAFLGVEWPYEHGGAARLLRFDDRGRPSTVLSLADSGAAFWRSGTRLLTHSGEEFDTGTGAVIRRIEFAEELRRAGA